MSEQDTNKTPQNIQVEGEDVNDMGELKDIVSKAIYAVDYDELKIGQDGRVDYHTQLIQAHITKELREVIGDNIPEDWDDELDGVQNWQYYDDYKSNAYDFVNGYNKARAEQRQRAKAKGYDV